MKSFLKRNEDEIVDVAVTVDGTWQKRYGHNLTLGVTFVILADTGEVLDYEAKSSYCKKCQYNTGDHDCSKNHQGSSDSMEKICAAEMFCRSIEKHNLRYTVYIGDGGTNSFAEVREKMKEKSGDDYSVTKEDCIGHIQKCMGAALRMYKSKNRGQKLSDGKTIVGKGRLTDNIVDSIQNYYGQAIRSNVGNLKATQGAVWAIYYHIIDGPSEESLKTCHSFCPTGPKSWCKFQLDKVNGTNLYHQKNCLPFTFCSELKHIFARLSSDTLLSHCKSGMTQNQNESLNNTVWARCPKRVFCGIHRLRLSVCDAICTFNSGAQSRRNKS